MSFTRPDSYKLLLAIAAVLSSTSAFAADDSAERAWSCNMNAQGEWDCQVNDNPQPEPSASDTAQTTTKSGDAAGETDSDVADKGQQQDSPSAATTAERSAAATAGTATAVEATTPGIADDATTSEPAPMTPPQKRPQDSRSRYAQSDSTAASTQAVAKRGPNNSDAQWNCIADGDAWNCSRQGQAVASGSASSTAGTAAETAATAGAGTAAVAETSQPQMERTGRWDCQADGDEWNCAQEEVPVRRSNTAVAATAVADRRKAAPLHGTRAAALDSDQPYSYLDWYYYEQGQKPVDSACEGQYIEPDVSALQEAKRTNSQTIYANAMQATTNEAGDSVLKGDINVRHGGQDLYADSGSYNRNTQVVDLEGNVRLREPGLLLLSDSAQVNMQNGTAQLENPQYVLHGSGMRGQAAEMQRRPDQTLRIINGFITGCAPADASWAVAAKRMDLDINEGVGTVHDMTLRVADVPVVYLPYFYFPLDDRRRSGFLYPRVQMSSEDGFDLATPYYFNLAPNYDDTFTPRLISKRGLLLGNEFRYRNTWSSNVLSGAYLPGDDEYHGRDRWMGSFQHFGQLSSNWYTHVDYTRVSDDDYMDDINVSGFDIDKEDDLDELGEIFYDADTWRFTTRVHAYQHTDTDIEPYEMLPQLLLEGRQVAFGNNSDFNYRASFTRFDRDASELMTPEERTNGSRLHLAPTLSYSFETPWSYIRPSVGYWYSRYDLEDQPESWSKSPNVSVPIASIDTGLRFERPYKDNMTQTLEPRLMLLSVSQDDQSGLPEFDSNRLEMSYYNLFNPIGYSGGDHIAGTRQATLGVSSAFYDAEGRELTRLGIAQAYYFEDRDRDMGLRPGDISGEESESNYATSIDWHVTPTLHFSHDSEIDKDDLKMVQQNYRLSYEPDDRRLVYLSYRDNTGMDYREDPDEEEKEVDLAFKWPLNANWSMIGRWRQDTLRSENLDTLFGLQYASCCWKVRLTGRRWTKDYDEHTDDIDRDSGIFLEFILKGLGSFGERGNDEFLGKLTGNYEDYNEKF